MKRILSLCLSVLFLLTALPMSVATVTAAETDAVDLETVFKSNLNFLDQYYTLNPEFMISKMCGVLYPWSEAEANNFADKPMEAEEFEAALYRYFAPTDEQLMSIRNYTRYDYVTDSHVTFFNPETCVYNLFVVGGFGGSMPERQYQRYLETATGYTVFYAHITYDVLPMTPEIMAELEALEWPETFTYEGKEYENGPDGYTCIVSIDDYGNKYEVQYNDGILRILSQTSYTAAPESDFEYSITDGEATITAYVGAGGDVIIPATLGGCPVTVIGERAFDVNDSLTSVVIPDSVRTIDKMAFRYCEELRSVYFGSQLTKIGDSAFAECYSLRSVVIPDSVVTLGAYAFNCSAVREVTIGSGLTTISEGAFCFANIETLVIPDTVTTICQWAFDGASLEVVYMGSGVTCVEDNAFSTCSFLTDVYYPGTKADRENMDVGANNDFFLDATWHYGIVDTTPGDADGDGVVSVQDVALFQRYLNGWDEELDTLVCDVNSDGSCDNKDLALLVRYLNGWDVELKLPQ